MNALKRSLLTLALAAGVSAPALLAQPPSDQPPGPPPAGERGERPGPGMRGDRLKQLAEALGLTEEQKTQLKPILAEEAAALKAIWEDKAIERDARREKVKAVRDSFAPKIDAILTPEQKAKHEELKKQMRGPGGPGGPGGPRANREEKK
jgi:protein CpxP